MPLGNVDAGIMAVYSDGGAGMGRINNTGGMDTSWGFGGSLAGQFNETLHWQTGASYAETEIFHIDALPIDMTRKHVYLTGGVEWKPIPQYSVIGQVIYESAEFGIDIPIIPASADTKGEAVTVMGTWIYRM